MKLLSNVIIFAFAISACIDVRRPTDIDEPIKLTARISHQVDPEKKAFESIASNSDLLDAVSKIISMHEGEISIGLNEIEGVFSGQKLFMWRLENPDRKIRIYRLVSSVACGVFNIEMSSHRQVKKFVFTEAFPELGESGRIIQAD